MTLHLPWLQSMHWMAHRHFSRAVALVLGVIGVSLLFSALRVIDSAISGELVDSHPMPVAAPAASTAQPADLRTGAAAGSPSAGPLQVDDTVVVPEAAAEAISL